MSEISVIVPVYNTEKYIERCLDSILNQTFKNIEIIIVNDGSEDNSDKIINQWIQRNNSKIKIKYIKKENGGLSDARNTAIKEATGKYISFIDSDDYIDENLYFSLKKYMDDNIDLIKFKMNTVDENGKILEKINGPTFGICNGQEAFEKLCTQDKYIDPACIYLYRRQFFLENSFKYNVGMYHEDFGLTPLIIVKSKSFLSTGEYGYNYLKRNDSITGGKDAENCIKKANDVLNHYDNMLIEIERYDISKHTKDLIKRYYTNAVILKAKELYENKEEYNKYIKEIKKRKMYKNIKQKNIKQLTKRFLLFFNIKLYLKMR